MIAKRKLYEKWKTYFEEIGLPPSVVDKYLRYCRKLIYKELPPIFDLYHLAQLFGRTPSFVAAVVHGQRSFYRSFFIPKRKGGTREISSPYASLLECQRWILENILEKVRLSKYTFGFVKNRSIIDNATQHIGSKDVLKVDIKDFFPSISERRVISIFRQLGYTKTVSYYLARFCTLNGCLPQGGACSPYLCNIVSNKMDSRLGAYCANNHLVFTRYADDICVSGERIEFSTVATIRRIFESEGFHMNEGKTVLMTRGKKVITGISVMDGKLAAQRTYKRQIRKEMHFIEKYGTISHISKMRIRNPGYLVSLLGKVNYVLTVEPSNGQFIKYRSVLLTLARPEV